MNEERQCSQCGAALPAHSPQGLCPRCLLKWGIESQIGGDGGEGPSATADYTPPTPEGIAAHFPDLEILELIGRGGMGVVYKARQKRLDRLVALKILAPKIGQDPAFAERFVREARAMAMLSHPHVIAVHDFGQIDGLYYFIMEFVDGVNLRRLLDTGKLTPEEALAIVPQICEALQYAHDHGVVHRDIKPENLLLDKEGRVKIADFGIAKLVGEEAKDFTLTGADQIIGTLQYMAPEQIEHPLQVDHRADIYSLGVVFYQMLTGELPIGRFAPPSRKVQIDVRLDEVVLRALEKEPERRYQQASEIKTRMESIATTQSESPENAEAIAQEILDRDYTLDIGNCLNRGWALVKNDFWPVFGITALVLLMLYGAAALQPVVLVIGGPLLGGLCLFFLKRIRGEQPTVETAISGFRMAFVPLFFQLFLTGLVTVALTAVGLFCLVLPGVYFGVAWSFALAIAADKRFDCWPAMELSRKTILKHWWKVFGLLAVLIIFNLAGVLAFGIGVFITAPITLAAMMFAYEDIFGMNHRAAKKPLNGARESAAGSASVSAPGNVQPFDPSLPNTGEARGTPASSPASTVDDAAIEQARRQVQGPAIGLLITGILNWVLFISFMLIISHVAISDSPQPNVGFQLKLNASTPTVFLIIIPVLVILILSSLVIFAALKMKRLQAYGLAITAGILAIIIFPSNLIGLPIGIWALVVLNQRDVRGAFGHLIRPAVSRRQRTMGIAALVLCLASPPLFDLFCRSVPSGSLSGEFMFVLPVLELVALILGILGRKSFAGKFAVVLVSILFLVAGLFLLKGILQGRNVVLQPREKTDVQVVSPDATAGSSSSTSLAKTEPNTSAKSATFGPVLYREITQEDCDAQGFVFFNMEMGKLLKPPFPLVYRRQLPDFVEFTPELRKWITANQADILFHIGDKNWEKATLEMVIKDGQLTEWKSLEPETVLQYFTEYDAIGMVSGYPSHSNSGDYRAVTGGWYGCNAFRTRNCTMGIFQEKGFNDDINHGVVIRYKLVQSQAKQTAVFTTEGPFQRSPLPLVQEAWSLLPLEQGPLELSVPAGWTLEYRRNDSSDFYSASPKDAAGFLAFFRPALGKPEDISPEVRKLADALAESAKKQSDGKMSENYELDSFAGDECKGTYAVFRLVNTNTKVNMVYAVFMMSVDGQIWQGQFSGITEHWKQVVELLKTVRKKANTDQASAPTESEADKTELKTN